MQSGSPTNSAIIKRGNIMKGTRVSSICLNIEITPQTIGLY